MPWRRQPSTGTTAKRRKPLPGLRIDTTFGGCPINAITRDDIRDWIARMRAAGKRPSTIRNAYFLVRQVLGQAVQDNKLPANPADYMKLPTDHNSGGAMVVDDPAMFLTSAQVSALVTATPWPYNLLVHLAAWSGLRAAELVGLQVGDLALPAHHQPQRAREAGELARGSDGSANRRQAHLRHAQYQGQPSHRAAYRCDDRAPAGLLGGASTSSRPDRAVVSGRGAPLSVRL